MEYSTFHFLELFIIIFRDIKIRTLSWPAKSIKSDFTVVNFIRSAHNLVLRKYKIEICSYDIILLLYAPSFPHLSQNFQTDRQIDRRPFPCFRFMKFFYCYFLLFPCEPTIIYRMNSFIFYCPCVPLVSSYTQNVCADGLVHGQIGLMAQFFCYFLLFK